MDIQLKRGVLDICVLASLLDEDSYGYKIIKDISPYIDISESTLYPILRRLEESKSVKVYSVEHSGRLRKYYSITDVGKDKIKTFLNEFKTIMDVYNYISTEVLKNEKE
jgi:PadR family transcriptional regulator PadR